CDSKNWPVISDNTASETIWLYENEFYEPIRHPCCSLPRFGPFRDHSTIQILVDSLFTRDRQVIPSHDSSSYVRAPRFPRKVRFVQEVGQCKRVFFLRLSASSYWQLPHL